MQEFQVDRPVSVEITSIGIESRRIAIEYMTDAPIFLPAGELTIDYPVDVSIRHDDIEQIISCIFLPLAAISGPVTLVLPFAPTREDYWKKYISRFQSLNQSVTYYQSGAYSAPAKPPRPVQRQSNIGMLFGGGVESLFGLSVLASLKPRLFSLVGPRFMNNDHEKSSIKNAIEDRLERERDTKIYRIHTSARSLCPTDDDSILNKFCTGRMVLFFHPPTYARYGRRYSVKSLGI